MLNSYLHIAPLGIECIIHLFRLFVSSSEGELEMPIRSADFHSVVREL